MSLHEYEEGREIAAKDPPFYALIQAAMRRADAVNLEMLKGCWPEILVELQARYNAPGGLLQSEIKGGKKMTQRSREWIILSDTTVGVVYTVTLDIAGVYSCTCPDFQFRGNVCKHINEVKTKTAGEKQKNKLPEVEP